MRISDLSSDVCSSDLYQMYLLRQLLTAMIIVAVVMTGIIWLFVSVRAVESIVNRGLSFQLFLGLTGLQLPNFLVQIIPIARSEERRVGKACVSTCSSRGSPYH